ncbi:MAG: acyl-CoA thioesterase [Ignavibacteria bacterium]|nr:acyl-CoA thioesterase [Ignavibacteria bacterium]
MIKSELFYRVLYAHTDMMGVIYYAKYFEYFEAGRNDLLRNLNYPYSLLEQKGYALPVIETSCRFFLPGKYDQLLKIVTMMKNVPSVRLKLDYEIYNENTLLVSGYTIHSFVSVRTLRPIKPPEDFMQLIKSKF